MISFLIEFSFPLYEEIIFRQELDDLSKVNLNLSVKYYLTRQSKSNFINRRIDISDIPKSNDYDYFICGSIAFVRDFWRLITKSGIEEINVYTESFF